MSGDKHLKNMHFINLTFPMLVNILIFKSITFTNFWKAIYIVTLGVWNLDRKHLQ